MVDDDRPPPLDAARELTGQLFGAPRAVWIGGSVLGAHRTPTSDLDIVVVTRDRPAPYRQSFHWQGWPVELFVHDEGSLTTYCEHDFARRRPSISRMIADGVIVTDADGLAERLRRTLRARLAAGPPAPGRAELDRERYALSDLIDDLRGSADPDESTLIGWYMIMGTARLALLAGRHWLGTGKWLLRELRDLDEDLAERLMKAREDPDQLTLVAQEVLDGVGGSLWDGYHAPGARNPC